MGLTLMAALVKELTDSTTVNPISSGRVFPVTAFRESPLPFIVCQKISNPVVHASGADPGLRNPWFQVSIYDDSYNGARNLSRRVKTVLQDFSSHDGLLGDNTSGVRVQRIFYENEIDIINIDPDTQEKIFHIMQDYRIWATT